MREVSDMAAYNMFRALIARFDASLQQGNLTPDVVDALCLHYFASTLQSVDRYRYLLALTDTPERKIVPAILQGIVKAEAPGFRPPEWLMLTTGYYGLMQHDELKAVLRMLRSTNLYDVTDDTPQVGGYVLEVIGPQSFVRKLETVFDTLSSTQEDLQP